MKSAHLTTLGVQFSFEALRLPCTYLDHLLWWILHLPSLHWQSVILLENVFVATGMAGHSAELFLLLKQEHIKNAFFRIN